MHLQAVDGIPELHETPLPLVRIDSTRVVVDQTPAALLVLLEQDLTMALLSRPPGIEVDVDGRLYVDFGLGDWTGFYDWLRDDQNHVIGVRLWPSSEAEFICERAASLSYAEVEQNRKYVAFYFSGARDFDPSHSADQDFGENRIMASGDRLALTFGVHHLTPSELFDITTAHARWVAAGGFG